MSKQTIAINGKHYHAITGELLTDVASADDHDALANTHTISVKTTPATSVAKPATQHKAKPSQTLMRSAVKKPNPNTLVIRVQHELSTDVISPTVARKPSVTSISHARLERAQSTLRSEQISRFQQGKTASKLTVQHAHVPVRIAPEKPEEVELPAGAPQPKPNNGPEDMFTRAIANAQHHVDIKAHTKAYKLTVRRHFASLAVGASALLVIVGFAMYLNVPSLQIRVAGMQAGVSTINPNFAKAGFSYTGVSASQSKRVIGLKTSESSYSLVQQPTNWAGGQMIDHISSVSASGTPNFKTLQFGDQTVYRLNNGNATWVKDGTWYQLNGDRAIGDTQLRSLVQNS